MKTPRIPRNHVLATAVVALGMAGFTTLRAEEAEPRPDAPAPHEHGAAPETPAPARETKVAKEGEACGCTMCMKKMADMKRAKPGESGPPPVMRIQHLRQAAEHLQAAGYPELAAKAREEIGRINAETRRMEEKRQAAPAADMRREIDKLRRQIEELRGQIKKMKADAEPVPAGGEHAH